MQTIVIATHNQGKAREFARLLEPAGFMIKTLVDCGVTEVPHETGATFLENALIKARAAMEATGLPSLADDSGLCVDALDGAPGVFSARYGGFSSPKEQITHLLRQMEGQPNRTAAFVCQLVLLYTDGNEVSAEGRCEGEILLAPQGDGGFGYDPVFCVPSKNRSMAELTPEEKDGLSHRGLALRALLGKLS
ncbi:MAG: RdgB/HAM1 family non-canonical purine NTP pyrophosphatase [Oscillospiraceae bacterium]|nr:RdgB/HAM1 family non-canonical purine NTP pyrophosphatase [Oscillospiraceae bacterium]